MGAIVEAHNAEYARGRESYTLAMNAFAAMTNAEFQAIHLHPREARTKDLKVRELNDTVPDAYDWREKENVVTPIKNRASAAPAGPSPRSPLWRARTTTR